jgi:hypothetical protein
MNRILTSFLLLTAFVAHGQQKLLSPAQFLGYAPGERFTSHDRVIDYFRHVSQSVPNVKFERYGETYEGRPLTYAVVTSEENLRKLEEIRLNNLKRTGILEGGASQEKTAIVWLSYNVHGDEASSTEASMLTLYELTDPNNLKTREWLKNTVVILDPCLNPDGRDRYVNFYRQYGNLPSNPSGDAMEHHDPWPDGRPNHYLFDLNRDWAWLTQVESMARLKIYNQWLPHVHVDFHEQGHNNPYYFAPAAEPLHEVVSPWQREFQTMIGKNNAKYFDEQGWLYFTKEIFDLYYPSYGDTYPTYNGAIGMTYEQAGGGYAGLNINTETGDKLSLKDRITHHHTTGLSTIEITSKNAARVVDEFEKYFRENNNSPASPYKTYVIKGNNNPDKIRQITDWFQLQGIRFGHAAAKATKGFDFTTQAIGNLNISNDDIIVSTAQPKSRFITAVFEPYSKLPDSLTYDITAWNLMYAYDMKGYALTERINILKPIEKKAIDYAGIPQQPYAYIFRYQHLNDVAFLSQLMKANITVRVSSKSFSVGGNGFDPGTLIITRRNNEPIANFDSLILSTAKKFNRTVFTTQTGFVDKGKDFGSSELRLVKAPRIAVLFGSQTSSLSAGEIWHFFEQQIHYPITQLGTSYFKSVDLKKYDVLIVPEGYYTLFDENVLDQVSTWVSAGGKLILISSAINAFADRKIFDIKKYATDEDRSEAEKKNKELKEKEGFPRYEDAQRKQISESISGAIYKVAVDNSHPLGFGLGNFYYSLKTNDLRFAYLDHGWNVGIIKGKAKPVQGFAGFKTNSALDNSLIFGVENQGHGQTVYLVDNPLFRSFWENGKMLFSNAVFMVGE